MTENTSVVMAQSPAIGALPPHVQQQLELRKMANQVAGQIASMSWGKQLDLATRRAVADWGRQFRVDVTTEIDVLGANIYLNSRYYLRRLAEMIETGLVEYAYADHVEADSRLDLMEGEGDGEKNRRLRERIKHQIAEKAASAVVFRIKLRSMDREIVGVKWCGNGTRPKDPVGDQFPVESSESRAARRAIRQISSHVPKIADEVIEVEEAADKLGDRIADANVSFTRSEVAARIDARPLSAPINPSDPYSLDHAPPEREPGDEGDEEEGGFTPPF